MAGEFGHGFSCFVCYVCGVENGANRHHLFVFSVDVAFARHIDCGSPPPSTPIAYLGIGYSFKNYLK